ncbi:MAG: archaeal proteasome endopeptidase complex subunit beta [Theionarchaea archaeon]|nr:MAG: proteasome subunit beta [Theionarchaea archaeon DG-70]MBU7009609.1 archaeal proteasome endopeptidase complex subunit beta [Theionarchaea archaeon]
MDAKKGTTTVVLVGKDGVVLAADTRASMGSAVAHKNAQKIFQVSPSAGATGAGSVGDIQNFVDLLRVESNLYRMKTNQELSVKSLATLASRILFSTRVFPYYAMFIIGGYDSGPTAFALDPFGGMNEDKWIASGSGMQIAHGLLEDQYKEDMSLDEMKQLAMRCINAATHRDLGTGDSISIAVITKDGYKELTKEEIEEVL